MRPHLSLPLPTRYADSPIVPVIEEREPIVEAVGASEQVDFIVDNTNGESELNVKIVEAQINAESNRRMSMDSFAYSEDHPTSPEHFRPPYDKAISFGNESEIGYDEEQPGVLLLAKVRSSKDFDGNRSGRPSAKE